MTAFADLLETTAETSEGDALRKQMARFITPKVLSRFWSHVERGEPSACWPWLAGTDKDGYGKFQITISSRPPKPIHVRSHRLALFLNTGQLPPAVLHKCDNPPCCNPEHLFAGTQRDNRADCVAKGRHARGDRSSARRYPQPRGERAHHAKLSDAQVEEIRRRYVPRTGVGELVREFGITYTTVRAIGLGCYPRIANARKDPSA